MSRHDAIRATWSPGQLWETRNDTCAHDPNGWVPVGDRGRAEPKWDEHQEYRRVEEPAQRVSPDAMDAAATNGLAWAVSRWQDEVSQRPLVNVHRRTLDDTWRQVIRYFGGDPEKLIGPDHDTLHMQAQEDRAWKPPAVGVKGTSNDQGEQP